MPDLVNSMFIAGAGMKAQSERLKIIAQNIANADNQHDDDGTLLAARVCEHAKSVTLGTWELGTCGASQKTEERSSSFLSFFLFYCVVLLLSM